jgi:hypothetical protein
LGSCGVRFTNFLRFHPYNKLTQALHYDYHVLNSRTMQILIYYYLWSNTVYTQFYNAATHFNHWMHIFQICECRSPFLKSFRLSNSYVGDDILNKALMKLTLPEDLGISTSNNCDYLFEIVWEACPHLEKLLDE